MQVWVVQSGEWHDEYGIDFIALTPEAAMAVIREEMYPSPPHVVRWDAPEHGEYGWTLVGHFEFVLGHSTRHTRRFDIEPHEVHGVPFE